MKATPLKDMSQGPLWEFPINSTARDFDRDLGITVDGVEVRRGMISVVHRDHDSQEATDLAHMAAYQEGFVAAKYVDCFDDWLRRSEINDYHKYGSLYGQSRLRSRSQSNSDQTRK